MKPWPSSNIGPVPGLTMTEAEVDSLYGLDHVPWASNVIYSDGARLAVDPDILANVAGNKELPWQSGADPERIAYLESLLSILARYKPLYVETLRLVYLQGLSQIEASEMLGISQPAVWSRIHYGLMWLSAIARDPGILAWHGLTYRRRRVILNETLEAYIQRYPSSNRKLTHRSLVGIVQTYLEVGNQIETGARCKVRQATVSQLARNVRRFNEADPRLRSALGLLLDQGTSD